MSEWTADERALLLRTAADRGEYTKRCAERCLGPNRPENVKAQGAKWQQEADIWKSIIVKLTTRA